MLTLHRASHTIPSMHPDMQRRLQRDVEAVARLWAMPSLATAVSLRVNRRLTGTVARYVREDRTIELGPRFLALRGRRLEVLVHELAHAAVALGPNKRTAPHGPEWQALVRAAGFEAHARMACHTTRHMRPSAARYEHRCAVCQMVRLAARPVRRWRCRQCVEAGLSGQLQITRKATSAG